MLAPDGTLCVVLPAAEEEAFRAQARTSHLAVFRRLLVHSRRGSGSGTARVLLAFCLMPSRLPGQHRRQRAPCNSQLRPNKTRGDDGEMMVRCGSGYSDDYIALTRPYYAVDLCAAVR